MKKLLSILILSFLFFLTSCGKKEAEPNTLDKIINRNLLIAGVKQDAGPFGFLNEKGELEGFDIDVAKYIAKNLTGSEKNVKFVTVTSNTRIEAVTSGEVDMVIATMTNTESRRYLVDFSIPYYVAGQTAMVPDDSKIYTFSDLKDKTTIVVLGSTSEQNLRRVIPTARIVGYSDYKEAFKALKDGKGDALSTDDTIISGFISKNEGYRALKNRISTEHYSIGIKQTDDKCLKQSLDSIITEMKNNGTLKHLKEKWDLI